MVKGPPTNAGDMGSIPGWGRSPGGMATHSSILAWKSPWIEGPGVAEIRTAEQARTHRRSKNQTDFKMDLRV